MHIGILEDDELLAAHLAEVLKSVGHTSSVFNSARTFLPALNRNTFDLLIFDWRLPDQDGVKVLKQLRASFQGETPVIFLTAVHDEQAIVTALEAGADDYCVKPLRPAEFLARVAAVQRRIYPAKQSAGPQVFQGYTFDPVSRLITWEAGQAQFSGKEFELARFLFENADRSLSRERLMQEVWGREDDPFSRTLDVHVSRVRSRLGLSAKSCIRLRSVHGFGYELITVAAPEASPDASA